CRPGPKRAGVAGRTARHRFNADLEGHLRRRARTGRPSPGLYLERRSRSRHRSAAKAGVNAQLHQLCPPQIPSPLETVARQSAFRSDRGLAWAQKLARNYASAHPKASHNKRNPQTSSDFGVGHWMFGVCLTKPTTSVHNPPLDSERSLNPTLTPPPTSKV